MTAAAREVEFLRTLAAIVQHFGGRIEIDRRSIQELDPSCSITTWEDHATNKRVFALVKTTSTVEKADGCTCGGDDYGAHMETCASLKTSVRWVDGGSLGNGRCSFMRGRFDGPCCARPAGHDGEHKTDLEYAASRPAAQTNIVDEWNKAMDRWEAEGGERPNDPQ